MKKMCNGVQFTVQPKLHGGPVIKPHWGGAQAVSQPGTTDGLLLLPETTGFSGQSGQRKSQLKKKLKPVLEE